MLPLKKDQLKYLKDSKTLIRKLAEGKVTNNYLATHYMIISYIVKIALEYIMKNIQKLVLVPIEKWEKLGLKEPVKEIFSEK